MKRFYLFSVIVFQFLIIQQIVAEGTKELEPTITDYCKLRLNESNNYNHFAMYNATPDERLYITIENLGEKMYFGFGDIPGTVNCRIKNSSGTIVWGPMPLPGFGGENGYIEDYTQAVNGPNVLSATGYIPLTYVPTAVGDYYIEFDLVSNPNNRELELFDLTVIDTTVSPLAPIKGRLWSKFWQFSTEDIDSYPGFMGTMYVFTDDSVVTSLFFNGMQGHAFEVSCNQNGCYPPPTSFANARRSVNTHAGYAEYKIFLNDPDTNAFPSGTLGEVVPGSITVNSECDGSFNVTFAVTKVGAAQVLIEINPAPGVQPEDVVMSGNVSPGGNVFNWNGLNGLGVPVANGTQVSIIVSYIHGLTNFPVYDVERHLNGFVMEMVRPGTSIPITFWNDTLINNGTLNLTGCLSSLPSNGCHTWTGNYNGGLGNNHTVNTWWYATSSSSQPIVVLRKSHESYNIPEVKCERDTIIREGQVILFPGDYSFTFTSILTGCDSTRIYQVRDNPLPVVDLGPDISICDGFTHQFDAGGGVGYTYQWDNITTGINNIANTQTYTTGTAGFYRVTVTNTFSCPQADSVHLFVTPKPRVTNDPMTDYICSHSLFTLNLTSDIPGATFSWVPSVISGNITGASSGSGTQISHTLINTIATNSVLNYTITPLAVGCFGNDTIYTVTVKPKPEITTTPLTYTLCSPDTIHIPLTSQVATPSFDWVAVASSGNVTGYSDGTGSVIHQGLTNTGYDIETVFYGVDISADGCTGNTVTFTVTVNPRPDLTTTPLIHSQCNDLNTGITLTSNVSGTLFTWIATASSGNLSGQSNSVAPGTVINQAIHNSGSDIDTVYYTIVPEARSCTGDTMIYKVAVYPTPDLSNSPPSQQQCNNLNTNTTLTSHITGTLFTWTASGSSPNVSGFSDNITPTAIIDQTLFNSGFNIETVTYHLTPTANGCDGQVADYIVTVFPTPDLSNSPAFQSQCNIDATAITLLSNVANTAFTWTCTQTSGNITGWVENPGPGTTFIDQTLVLSGYVSDSVIYHLTASANGCDGMVTDYTVIVNPITELTVTPLFDSICSEQTTNIILTATCQGTTFTWTAAPGVGNITGFSDGSGDLISQQLINPDLLAGGVIYTITPATTSCAGLDYTFTQWVKPLPHLSNLPKGDSICNNTGPNLTLTSDVLNTWFTWTATGSSGNISGYSDQTTPTTLLNQTLVNTGYDLEWATYQVAPTAAGCVGPDSNYVVTVYPVPDMSNNPPDTAICSGEPTGVTLLSNITGTLFTWTATGSTGNVTGFSNQSTPTGILDQILINSGDAIEWVTYQVTPTANGCDGNVWTYTATVFPVPDVSNSPMSKEICNNNNTDIDLTSNITGTLFTWTATGSSANITGYTDNITPSTHIGDNLVNLGDINETVTYHITPHANGCDGIEVEYIVTVVPSPFLTNTPLRQDQCNNLNTSITLQSNVAGTEFSWTCTHISGNITGYSNSTAPGTLISQLLVNSSFITDSVIYHLTPVNSGCPGSVTDYTVVVFPVPDLSFSPTEQTVCEGDICNIENLSNVSGTTFSWIAIPSSANLSGYSDGSGDLIAQTIDNAGSTIEWVTYQVTPTANGCPPGTTLPVVLTVNPRPIITNPITSYSICNNTTTNITIQSDVTGATVAWRAFSSSPNITGFSDGSGFVIAHTLVNSGYTIDSITYRIAATANSCLGDSTDINVVVFPVADVIFNPTVQELCSGQTTGLTLQSNVANTTYAWTATASSPDVTGHSNGTGDLIQQTLVNSGYDIETVTYQVTPTANGCNGDLWTYVVTVYPVPDVSNSPMLKEICNNNNTDIDITSNVSGTLFTWTATGSSANIQGFTDNLTPATHIGDNLINLGDINETVTYHITPHANGCDGTTVDYVVTVVPSPFLTNSPLRQPQCNAVNTDIVLESNVAGTIFSWTCTQMSGNITGYNNSAAPGALISQMLTNSSLNSDSVIYHLTPENSGCPGSITNYTVVVFPVPDVYFNPTGETVCEGVTSLIQNLSHTIGATYSWTATASSVNLTGYSNGTGDVIAQTIDNAGSTIEWVTYQVTPTANGCPPGTSMPVILIVNPRPAVTSVPARQSICNGGTSNLSLLADVAGSTFAWRAFSSSPAVTGFSDGSGFTIAQTLVNSGFSIDSVTYRVAGTANSCPGDSTDIHVVVYPVADVIFTPASQELCSGETTGIALTSNVAGANYSWTVVGSSPDVTGYSSGSGSLIQQTLVNSGYLIPTVTYQVTPAANGCTGTQNSAVVGVNPWPAVSLAICLDTLLTTESQPFSLKGGNPPGGVFAGTGVFNGTFFPALAGTGRHTITYYYQNTYGCDRIDSIHVTVAEPIIHSCGDTLIDIRDNQSYPTVQIGTQCWMSTNLNFGNIVSSSQMQRDNCVNEKYCYNDSPANCASNGGLYQWSEVMRFTDDIGAQGLCPSGWHIPTEPDWTALFNALISNGFAGSALKYNGYSGFNAFLSGIRFHNSVWRFPANDLTLRSKLYWSSSASGSGKAWAHGMNEVVSDIEFTPSVSLYPALHTNAFAVRCIKD